MASRTRCSRSRTLIAFATASLAIAATASAKLKREQGSGVTRGKKSLLHHPLNRLWQRQHPQKIRDRCAVLPDRFRDLLLGQFEIVDQPTVAPRFLDGIEVCRWRFSTRASTSMV